MLIAVLVPGIEGAMMDTEVRFVEEPEVQFVDRRRKVWLECDSEPYDFRGMQVLRIRHVVHGVALVSFVCPRCGKKHTSLLFR